MKGINKYINFNDLEGVKAYVSRNPLEVNQKDSNGLYPLHKACLWGMYEIVEFFISLPFIDLNVLDEKGRGVYDYSKIGGNIKIEKIIKETISSHIRCNI